VVWALILREVITRFGRQNIGVLWLIAEPMIFTLGVATFWYSAGMHHGSGIPIVAFAITGYSSVLMWRNTVGRCARAVQVNMSLLYHRNVLVIDVLLARIVLEIAGATASFAALTIIFAGGEWINPPQDMGLVLAGWLMLAWFGLGLSLTIGAATAFSALVERIWHPASYLLFPLSGAAFMADWWAPPPSCAMRWDCPGPCRHDALGFHQRHPPARHRPSRPCGGDRPAPRGRRPPRGK
jgi:ABC-type polysaccharide/polyol phosphate export permease